jgi:diaminohydroxyphosphoribosylaminopyrimidine deaminase / 5-amino-6-(5-phosphoribosylamino)uracil reductase
MPPPTTEPADASWMRHALALGQRARLHAPPNPWVGAVVVAADGEVFEGFTAPPGGPHAERRALEAAGARARGAVVYTTLEPCAHHGRTGPCTDALIGAGVARVVVGVADPDPAVAGAGIAQLAEAGIDIEMADEVVAADIERSLQPYLHHRRTGRPYVVLKMATTIDGRTAAPDRTSEWITGATARADVHRLRAESDAIVVGAGTVRADDPLLTVRSFHPSQPPERDHLDPRRIVLGGVPPGARVEPAESHRGDVDALVVRLGAEGVIQLLVEGGATVAGQFHRAGLVDRYVFYLAPAILGGDDGVPVFVGAGAATMAAAWRGAIDDVQRLGDDLRVDLVPRRRPA